MTEADSRVKIQALRLNINYIYHTHTHTQSSHTLGIQRQVFVSVWTFEHRTLLDLFYQQVQEVTPGHSVITTKRGSGKRSPVAVFEPEDRCR